MWYVRVRGHTVQLWWTKDSLQVPGRSVQNIQCFASVTNEQRSKACLLPTCWLYMRFPLQYLGDCHNQSIVGIPLKQLDGGQRVASSRRQGFQMIRCDSTFTYPRRPEKAIFASRPSHFQMWTLKDDEPPWARGHCPSWSCSWRSETKNVTTGCGEKPTAGSTLWRFATDAQQIAGC